MRVTEVRMKLVKNLNDTKLKGYADITLESTVTASVPVRYLISQAPTATDGKALNHLTVFDVTGRPNLEQIKFIQTGAGTHTLHIEYYK